MTDITTVVDLLTRGGIITALVIALIGGWRGWYVWGPVHRAALEEKDEQLRGLRTENQLQLSELRKDRDYWRDQAWRALSSTERVASVFEESRRQSG